MAQNQSSDGKTFSNDMNRVGQGVGAVKDDVKSLAHDAADAARSGMTELKQGAHHAVDAAKDKLHRVGEAAHEKFDEVKQAAEHAGQSLKQVIARNPITSIGVAAGIGMLVGLAFFRPRS